MFPSLSKGLTVTAEESSSNVNVSATGGSMSSLLIRRNGTTNTRSERSVFSLTSEEEDDVQFDTSDGAGSCEVLMRGKPYPSVQDFASAIPNHLLLGSLLEHLCCVYERDPARSRVLFKVIGQRLAAMNLLSPLAVSDEFCTVRLQHNRAFTELLHSASSSLFPQTQMYLNTDAQKLTLRQKESLLQTQTSRYLSEFEETSPLGKGSYGKVFKVINKMDGQHYAVKKILIKNWSRDDCMKVLREVKVLSSLQHANVVGYHTAWMEHVQPITASNPKHVLPALESPAQRESSEDSSDGSSIVFEGSEVSRTSSPRLQPPPAPPPKAPARPGGEGVVGQAAVCPKTLRRAPKNFVPCVFLDWAAARGRRASWEGSGVTEDDSRPERNNSSSSSSRVDQAGPWTDRTAGREGQFHLMLYIQMQLCERSLKEWISERNAGAAGQRGSGDPYSCVDAEHTLGILGRILEGVEYIHSRGIMHRDLKPRNIFLHGHDCHVRIGDFGLACRDIIVDDHEPLPSNFDAGFSHTTGVGTFVYAAPEQLEGSQYDSKSDMYSLGAVALELFQPFGTEMERVRTLGHLRDGRVPESFSARWPVLATYVRRLTGRDSCRRPSATQLLQSELFSNKDVVIHGLQKRVEEQEEEIVQLRRQISRLQSTQSPSHPPDET